MTNFYILFNAAFVAWLSDKPENWPVGLERVLTAVDLLRGLGDGTYNELAFALDMAARLSLALGKLEDALHYMKEALQLLNTVPQIYGHEQFNFTHSKILRATGQSDKADDALKRAYKDVMQVAEQIEDNAMRRSWLENVRYNREIITEAKERGVAG